MKPAREEEEEEEQEGNDMNLVLYIKQPLAPDDKMFAAEPLFKCVPAAVYE